MPRLTSPRSPCVRSRGRRRTPRQGIRPQREPEPASVAGLNLDNFYLRRGVHDCREYHCSGTGDREASGSAVYPTRVTARAPLRVDVDTGYVVGVSNFIEALRQHPRIVNRSLRFCFFVPWALILVGLVRLVRRGRVYRIHLIHGRHLEFFVGCGGALGNVCLRPAGRFRAFGLSEVLRIRRCVALISTMEGRSLTARVEGGSFFARMAELMDCQIRQLPDAFGMRMVECVLPPKGKNARPLTSL